MNDRIKELQREIEAERSRIQNCKHDFGKVIFDPETVMEGYGSVQDGAGSDPHWSYAGYRETKKDRWSRKCKICGSVEYTNKQEPIIKGYEPKF